jgi:hypothetical protein
MARCVSNSGNPSAIHNHFCALGISCPRLGNVLVKLCRLIFCVFLVPFVGFTLDPRGLTYAGILHLLFTSIAVPTVKINSRSCQDWDRSRILGTGKQLGMITSQSTAQSQYIDMDILAVLHTSNLIRTCQRKTQE